MNPQIQQFIELLSNLTVPNNEIRGAAERQYEAMRIDENCFLPLTLLSVITESTVNSDIRRLAAVLLRRVMIKDENSAYNQLDASRQGVLKTSLISALDNEQDSYLKARICDIVGELAAFIVQADDWPEVIPYTYSSMQSADPLQREMGLSLLGMLAEQAGALLSGDVGRPVAEQVVSVYASCLVDQSNGGRVMLAAVRSLNFLLTSLPQQSDVDRFTPLVEPLVRGLQMLAGWPEGEPMALTYAEAVIEIAEDCSVFFNPHLGIMFEAMCEFLNPQNNVSSALQHMVLEILITLAAESTKLVRKLRSPTGGEKGYFVMRLFPICVQMMMSIPEDDSWNSSERPEESAESVTDSDVAETALDRMCRSLGLSATWPVVSAQLNELLSSSSWQSLYTGLRYLGNYMEVTKNIHSKKQLREHVMDTGTRIMSFIGHDHPRVRGAAFYALGQFFSMHGGTITDDQVSLVLPHVLHSLPAAANPAPRVRRYVLVCIINIVDSCSAVTTIEANAGSILEAVAASLSEGPVMVQELCVAVIIGMAETTGGSVLGKYYDNVMPVLRGLLSHAHALGLESLWGQGMECCAMVGEASGKDKFYSDALEMMNSLVAMQSELEEGSEARKYLMKAWVRIARCLEADFLPFLDLVMGQLLDAMSQEVTADNMDPDELETRSDIHMVEMETGWVAVRTAAVEEQSSACQLVMLIAERLQEHFYAYVEPTVRALAPLLESPHEDVRSFAMVAMPELVRSTAKATSPERSSLAALTEYVVGLLIKSVETEGGVELIMTGLQALRQVFLYACTNWEELRPFTNKEPPKSVPETSIQLLEHSHMRALTQCAAVVLRDSLQRRAVLRAEAQITGVVDDDDEADEMMFQQESMELHYNIAELLGTIFRTHGPRFMEVYLEVWHDTVCTMGHENCLKEDRQFSCFIISDVIEFGLSPETVNAYFDTIFPILIGGCMTQDAGIRQTCAYAVGIAAEKHPGPFRPFAAACLNALAASISMGEGEEERGSCTDNAVSAVGILLERMDVSSGEESASLTEKFPYVWGQWLAYLPLRHDVEEGGKVLRQLSRLLKYKHATLFCNVQRVERGVEVLLEALGTELVGDDLTREIVHTLQLMRVCGGLLGPHGMETLADKLSAENAVKLKKFLKMDFSSPLQSSSPHAPAPIHDVLMRSNMPL